MGMDGCNTDRLADARGEGHGFACGGYDEGRNPYPKGGSLHDAWLEGWKAQKAGKTYTETVSTSPPAGRT